jgi:hypothetical protein
MIPKSGNRFSEKIVLNKKLERDDDSRKSRPALAACIVTQSYETSSIL